MFISVSFYKDIECINSNLLNFLYFTDASTKIVVHLKDNCGISFNDLIKNERIILNPHRIRTTHENSLPAHVSNFQFIEKLIDDNDKFCIVSPADLFIKRGVEEYVKKFDVGISNVEGKQKFRQSDNYCLEAFGGNIKNVYATLSEGSFYTPRIFRLVCQYFVEKKYMFDFEDAYPKKIPSTVESVPATVINIMNDRNIIIGDPITFSTPAHSTRFKEKLRISVEQVKFVQQSSNIEYFDKFTQTNKKVDTKNIFMIRRFDYNIKDSARIYITSLMK